MANADRMQRKLISESVQKSSILLLVLQQ